MVLNKNHQNEQLSQNKLATFLCMSASEVNAGIRRLVRSGLLAPVVTQDPKNRIALSPVKAACEECLISGVKYFFPVELGSDTRGIPTSYAAPVLAKHFVLGDNSIPVWAHAKGESRGLALEPLYSSVPESLIQFPDQTFYELLVLVDAIRSGRARERNLASILLKEIIHEKSAKHGESENVRVRRKKTRPTQ